MSTVQKLARQYISTYGIMDKVSAKRVAEDLEAGRIELKGTITAQDVSDAMHLVNAISYAANPEMYESGNGISTPEIGKQVLASQALNSPHIQQSISDMLPEGHVVKSIVKETMQAQEKSEAMQRTSETMKDAVEKGNDTGLDLGSETEEPTPTNTYATAAAGGYAYSGSAVFNREKRATPTGKAVMTGPNSGVYRGAVGNGDSRDSRGVGNTSNVNTAASAAD